MQEQENNVLALLEGLGAIITDSHLVYTSGRHGTSYVNKDALYPHPVETSNVCERLAAHFAHDAIEVVAGPTIGGVILTQWVAYHLQTMTNTPVQAVYAEEDTTGKRVFRRGYDARIRGKRVLIVEDVLNTGGSVRHVVDAVVALGGEVVGVGALCNRGELSASQLHVPSLYALVTIALESWEATACPLCQQGIPINTAVGKGAAFIAGNAEVR
jgi:orotate phosphoribosyltransferase